MVPAKRILLVEDNPGDARLLQEALREIDSPPFELIHVDHFNAAIECLKQECFGAVLLDLSLPDAKGIDSVVRMQREANDIPIIVLTGLDDDAVALDAVRAGAQDYLIKGQIDGRLLVRSVSYAVERKRLHEATRRHLEQITALKDINAAVTSTLDLSVVLDTLLEKIASLMPVVATTIRLRNKENGQLEPVGCRNIDEQDWKAAVARWKIDGSLSDVAIANKGPLLVADLQNDSRARDPEFCRKHGFTAYLGIPLTVNDEVLGLIACYAKELSAFGNQEIEFLSALAGQASVAIRNSQVHGEIHQLVRDLERANHVKDEFLGVMSHELRTPLNVTKGYIEMMQAGFFGEVAAEQQEALEKVANQTRVQLGMINNILNAIAMESEVATAHDEEVSLRNFLDNLQSAYPQPLDQRLTFRWDYASELPTVKTDQTKLQYILQNLINNAVKFTPVGSITVSAELIDEAANGAAAFDHKRKKLMFKVADTGVGIEEEFLPLIFEKFSQVDSSTTRVHEGIGLGLHIVKRCVELLNGGLRVDSERGKGTVFTVTIPCDLCTES
jgi:signal transduction histidine kinase/DNA-binding NarL/FixJ family response regulator